MDLPKETTQKMSYNVRVFTPAWANDRRLSSGPVQLVRVSTPFTESVVAEIIRLTVETEQLKQISDFRNLDAELSGTQGKGASALIDEKDAYGADIAF